MKTLKEFKEYLTELDELEQWSIPYGQTCDYAELLFRAGFELGVDNVADEANRHGGRCGCGGCNNLVDSIEKLKNIKL